MYPTYLKLAFEELAEQDNGLVVLAKGLGLELLFAKFIQHYIYLLRSVNNNINIVPNRNGSSNNIPAAVASDTTTIGYCAIPKRKVVFILNAGEHISMIQQALHSIGVMPLEMPLVVNSETGMDERKDIYSMGGLVMVTSRILIIDLLKQNIIPQQILGFLVYDAHSVVETSIESFVLRVCYEATRYTPGGNSSVVTGGDGGGYADKSVATFSGRGSGSGGSCFIKAFTESAEGLFSNRIHVNEQQQQQSIISNNSSNGKSTGNMASTTSSSVSASVWSNNGAVTVETLMRNLFVTKIFPYPRFHPAVASYFDNQHTEQVHISRNRCDKSCIGASSLLPPPSSSASSSSASASSSLNIIECPQSISVLGKAVHGALLVAISQGLNELKKSLGMSTAPTGTAAVGVCTTIGDNGDSNNANAATGASFTAAAYQGEGGATMGSTMTASTTTATSDVMYSLQNATLETVLTTPFDFNVRNELAPRWFKLSMKTKTLIDDLKSLRSLVDELLRYDSITFYMHLVNTRTSNLPSNSNSNSNSNSTGGGSRSMAYQHQQPSYWLSSFAGDQVFKRAKERIFKIVTNGNCVSSGITVDNDGLGSSQAIGTVAQPQYKPLLPPWWYTYKINERYQLKDQVLMPVGDLPSKWTQFEKIISEIRSKKKKTVDRMSSGVATNVNADIGNSTGGDDSTISSVANKIGHHVLVIARDAYTVTQLRDLLLSQQQQLQTPQQDQHGSGSRSATKSSGTSIPKPMDNQLMKTRFRWFVSQQAAMIRAQVRSLAWQQAQNNIRKREQELLLHRGGSAKWRRVENAVGEVAGGSGSISSVSSDRKGESGAAQTITTTTTTTIATEESEAALNAIAAADSKATTDADVDVETELGLMLTQADMCRLTVEQRLIILQEKLLLWQDEYMQAVHTRTNNGSGSGTGSAVSTLGMDNAVAQKNGGGIITADSGAGAAVGSDNGSDSDSDSDGDPKLTGEPLVTDCCVTMVTLRDLHSQYNLLHALQPDSIILYDADLYCMRQIELYHAGRRFTNVHSLYAAATMAATATTVGVNSTTTTTTLDASSNSKRNPSVNAGATTACGPSLPLDLDINVYFMLFQGSTDEHRYVATVNREKNMFQRLLRINKDLCVSLPDSQLALRMARREDILDGVTDTRRLGGYGGYSSSGSIQQRSILDSQYEIVVDIREFRSYLPNTLHGSGLFKLMPEVIYVGDYILSNDIAVERKGINDLIQSLAGGRLYTQAVNLVKYYSKPCLLIEFLAQEPFQFMTSSEMSSDIQLSSINSRICLLLMSFPTLRLLWARTPQMTAQLFYVLRRSQQQQQQLGSRYGNVTNSSGSIGNISVTGGNDKIDLVRVKGYGSNTGYYDDNDDDEDSTDDARAHTSSTSGGNFSTTKSYISTLLSLPGVTSNHLQSITNHVNTMEGLCNASQSELCNMLGDSRATIGVNSGSDANVTTTNLANSLFALFHTKYVPQP